MVGSRLIIVPSIPLAPFTTHVPGPAQPGTALSVVPFLGLARDLSALLLPVQPRSQFRADLERSLLAEARQQNATSSLADYAWTAGPAGARFDLLERRWVIGAAAAAAVGSAVSLAGIMAYVLHRRGDRAASGLAVDS
jgi:hypothetical protein